MEENISVVVDTSVWLGYLLPDENIDNECLDWLEMVDRGSTKVICPVLLPFEFLNGLSVCVSRKRISKEIAVKLFRRFRGLMINYRDVDYELVLKLAIKHKLSVYDSSYLWLALKNKCRLISMDKKLLLAYKLEMEEINC